MDSILTGTKLRNNFGQVVHTYVPLSPSSITWYWSKDGDVLLAAGKVTIGLEESATRDDLKVTCGLTACTPGSAPGPTFGNKYGKSESLMRYSHQRT